MYGVLGDDVQYSGVLVGRRPERTLAERHVVEEVRRLPSAPLVTTLTVITVPSFAPVGRGSPIMAPFS